MQAQTIRSESNLFFGSWRASLLRAATLFLTSTSLPCAAKDMFMLGPSAKAYAGAGQTVTAGTESLFYNPANLTLALGTFEVFTELDFQRMTYDFKYPDYDTHEFTMTSPFGFLGGAYTNGPFTLAFSYMPIPSPHKDIEKVLTREGGFEDDPIYVDIHMTGNNTKGEVLATGLGWRLSPEIGLGLSFISRKSGMHQVVDISATGLTAITLDFSAEEKQVLVGGSWRTSSFALGATYRPYRKKDLTSTVSVEGQDTKTRHQHDQGPSSAAVGAEYYFYDTALLADLQYTQWSQLDRYLNQPADYQDTLDVVLGLRYTLKTGRSINFAAGRFPHYLGDGQLPSRDAAGVGRYGFHYGFFDIIERKTASIGYTCEDPASQSRTQYFFLYQHGSRTVSESSVAFGTHEVRNYLVGFSWIKGY